MAIRNGKCPAPNNAAVVVRSVEARTTNTTKNKPSMDTIGTINSFIA